MKTRSRSTFIAQKLTILCPCIYMISIDLQSWHLIKIVNSRGDYNVYYTELKQNGKARYTCIYLAIIDTYRQRVFERM